MSPTLKRKAGGDANGAADAKKPKQSGIMSFFGGKTSPNGGSSSTKGSAAAGGAAASSTVAAPKFDKSKWVESLTPEQRDLLKLEIETLHESWLAHLKDDVTSKEFLDLKRFLNRETQAGRKWFPPAEDVYSWSRHCPFNQVKVVVVGQDPYHNHNQAHGLAFSVRPPTPAPPSLKNIYVALKRDYPTFSPPPRNSGLLTPWADRGVLLLNTCLTVRAHEANSHSNRGWERFTQRVLDLVAAKRTRGVVFMAWGTPAGRRVVKMDQQKHLVLKSVHPSPLSASRGFFDCGHFRKANEWLVQRYGEGAEIDWDLSGALDASDNGKGNTKGGKSEENKLPNATANVSNGEAKVQATKTVEEEKENAKIVEKESVEVKDRGVTNVTEVEVEKEVEVAA